MLKASASSLAPSCGFCIRALLIAALAAFYPVESTAAPEDGIMLREIKLSGFSSPPEQVKVDITPSFKEPNFPLAKAANLRQVEKLVGKLTKAQRDFMEKNRFLLLPKKKFKVFPGSEGVVYDEMLMNFSLIGGSPVPEDRLPENAVFVGPDPFLHAFHKYFSTRLKHLEETSLSRAAFTLAKGLYANALAMRAEAGKQAPVPQAEENSARAAGGVGEAAPSGKAVETGGGSAAMGKSGETSMVKDGWERLAAQMLVPLVLLENCHAPGGVYGEASSFDPDELAAFKAAASGEKPAAPSGPPDSLENALKVLDKYKPEETFGPERAAALKTEIERIYKAEGMAASTLGLFAATNSSGDVDYTQFGPRGYYTGNSVLRAYFRSMIFYGQVGWNLRSAQGAADAINFALLMSVEQSVKAPVGKAIVENTEGEAAARKPEEQEPDKKNEDDQPPLSLAEAWKEVMEITGFFSGSPDEPSYPEWRAYLQKESGVDKFTVSTAFDATVIARVQAGLGGLKADLPHFAALREKAEARKGGASAGPGILRVLPQRFTVPWLIASELTYADDDDRRELPDIFSALWTASVMGSAYADGLLEKQAQLSRRANMNIKLPAIVPAVPALKQRIAELAAALGRESDAGWFSSAGAGWTRLLGTLTADYGAGYPLYMRSPMFRAKQLESFMGAYTELRHDTMLYEKPNYAELGDGGDDGKIPPVVKGFVEPNLAFWHGMIRLVDYMAGGFEHYKLFLHDLEEYGALSEFRMQLGMCAKLAEKELRGEKITDVEYEELRAGMNINQMAAPMGDIVLTDEDIQSALIVDVQTSGPAPGARPDLIVYEALAEPLIMLVLVGNEGSPRVAVGMAFNHREFVAPYGPRITDAKWKKLVYGDKFSWDAPATKWGKKPLPAKNFWYNNLLPQ